MPESPAPPPKSSSPPPPPPPQRFCQMRQKEVINACTCRSLGCVSDIEFDCRTGRILSLVVPGPGKLCWFLGRDFEYVIPWKCVTQVGADIILVEVNEEEIRRKCA